MSSQPEDISYSYNAYLYVGHYEKPSALVDAIVTQKLPREISRSQCHVGCTAAIMVFKLDVHKPIGLKKFDLPEPMTVSDGADSDREVVASSDWCFYDGENSVSDSDFDDDVFIVSECRCRSRAKGWNYRGQSSCESEPARCSRHWKYSQSRTLSEEASSEIYIYIYIAHGKGMVLSKPVSYSSISCCKATAFPAIRSFKLGLTVQYIIALAHQSYRALTAMSK